MFKIGAFQRNLSKIFLKVLNIYLVQKIFHKIRIVMLRCNISQYLTKMLQQYFNCNEILEIFLSRFCNILCYVGKHRWSARWSARNYNVVYTPVQLKHQNDSRETKRKDTKRTTVRTVQLWRLSWNGSGFRLLSQSLRRWTFRTRFPEDSFLGNSREFIGNTSLVMLRVLDLYTSKNVVYRQ